MEDEEKSGLKNDLEISQSRPTLIKKKKSKINASENYTVHNDGAKGLILTDNLPLKRGTLLVGNLSPDVKNGVQKDLETMHNISEIGGKQRKKTKKKLNDSENCNINIEFKESSVVGKKIVISITFSKSDVDVDNLQDDPIVGVNKKLNKRKRKHEVLVENAVLKSDVDVENVQDDPRVEAKKNKRKKMKSKHDVLDDNIVCVDSEVNALLVENPSPLKRDVALEITQNGKSIREDNPHLKSNVNVESVLRKKKMKHNALEDSSSVRNDLEEDTLSSKNPSSQDEIRLQKDLETMQKNPERDEKQRKKKKKKNVVMEHEVLVENGVLKNVVDGENVQDDPIVEAKKNKRKKRKSKHDVLDDNSVHADVEKNHLLMENPSPLKRDVAVEITQNGKSIRDDNPPLKSNVNVESVLRKKIMKHNALEDSSSVLNDLEEKNPSLSNMGPIGNDADLLTINKICPPEVVVVASPEGSPSAHVRKKLLILDVNGLLADIGPVATPDYLADFHVSGKKVFQRPFCEDFLRFCMEKFEVAVWSSRKMCNVNAVLTSLVGKSIREGLFFCWDQSYCTQTGFMTLENKDKPLVLKELRNVWNLSEDYNESNTLLIDDSPYKALRNPAHTAIFPRSYCYNDTKDCSLGPGGDLRVYLEEIAACENVQEYVKKNPFGQRPITETCISWSFYRQIALVDSNQHNAT